LHVLVAGKGSFSSSLAAMWHADFDAGSSECEEEGLILPRLSNIVAVAARSKTASIAGYPPPVHEPVKGGYDSGKGGKGYGGSSYDSVKGGCGSVAGYGKDGYGKDQNKSKPDSSYDSVKGGCGSVAGYGKDGYGKDQNKSKPDSSYDSVKGGCGSVAGYGKDQNKSKPDSSDEPYGKGSKKVAVYADAGGPGIFRSSPASGDPVEAWWRRDPVKGWSQIFVSLAAAPAGGKSSGGKDSGNGWSSGGKGLSSESGDQVERRRREYRRWWNETLIDARKKDIEELQHQIEAKKEEIEFLKGQIEVER